MIFLALQFAGGTVLEVSYITSQRFLAFLNCSHVNERKTEVKTYSNLQRYRANSTVNDQIIDLYVVPLISVLSEMNLKIVPQVIIYFVVRDVFCLSGV